MRHEPCNAQHAPATSSTHHEPRGMQHLKRSMRLASHTKHPPYNMHCVAYGTQRVTDQICQWRLVDADWNARLCARRRGGCGGGCGGGCDGRRRVERWVADIGLGSRRAGRFDGRALAPQSVEPSLNVRWNTKEVAAPDNVPDRRAFQVRPRDEINLEALGYKKRVELMIRSNCPARRRVVSSKHFRRFARSGGEHELYEAVWELGRGLPRGVPRPCMLCRCHIVPPARNALKWLQSRRGTLMALKKLQESATCRFVEPTRKATEEAIGAAFAHEARSPRSSGLRLRWWKWWW
jgi:hypothetical protein